jgi:hypothetical protein
MDVELPERRIRSIKDFAAHVATVSLGILIAFGFEGTRDWWHHRSLVAEARANLLAEMADNKRELVAIMKWVRGGRQQIEQAVKQAERLLAADDAVIAEDSEPLPNFSIIFVEASRTTAEATGAFAHMKYADVKKYAEVYNLQREFMARTSRFHDHMSAIVGRRLSRQRPAELQDRRQSLLVALQYLRDAEGMGNALLDGYRAVGLK